MLQKLDHPNVLKMIEYGTGGEYIKSNGQVKSVSYIVFELIDGGELFDILLLTGPFRERIARHFFR